ncbi:TonB-dependent receptor [Pseudoduganella namucuonensis]|uniref:TonB-dependent receptor n=1 Tax=Pseudoduganella namucuonensis TaxID=1035707 RepID=A0A1I7J9L0_9BURK|nr:TonB-dependent receptor [Pseudoduganella namucuonensis]SFU81867.1 TonB-dependent receptor [Pseudoduganella namucuonensis]
MKKIGTMNEPKPLRLTALAFAAAQVAALYSGAAQAQTAPAAPVSKDKEATTVVVTGQRAAMQSATELKQNAEEVLDGVVAEEAGKLPDKSITEVLQRVVGVTMDRNKNRDTPEIFSVEGSGISVRGLTWGSSTLNGRESFSAGKAGRELSWGDVPPELMAAVVVHKNPPAELVEGGVSGQVNLRTALPFDYKGDKFSASASVNHNALGSRTSPALSGLVSKRWENSFGQWGGLLSLSGNVSNTRNDTIQVDAYFPRTDLVPGQTVWVPKSGSWRTNTSENKRSGIYGALQWKKANLESALTYFQSRYAENAVESALYTGLGVPDIYLTTVSDAVYDSRGVLQKGRYTYPLGGQGSNQFAAGGLFFNSNQAYSERQTQTGELAWNAKWKIDERWSVQNDLQWVHATGKSFNNGINMGTFVPSMNIDLTRNPGEITFDDAAKKHLAEPGNYFVPSIATYKNKGKGDLYAWKTDVRFKFDHDVLRDLRFGVRLTKRDANYTKATGNEWYPIDESWAVRPTGIAGQLPNFNVDQGWQGRANYGYLSDPKYAALMPVELANYDNFFNGKVPVPGTLVKPSMDAVKNYPATYQNLLAIKKYVCQDNNTWRQRNDDCSKQGADWVAFSYDGNPKNTVLQSEKTQAAYLMTRFGFDDLRFPIEGSVGVRVVHTDTTAHGYTVFKTTYNTDTPASTPRFGNIDQKIDSGHRYLDVLPSLNLKMELTPKLQARFAFAKSMYRPKFGDLAEYVELRQELNQATGEMTYRGSNYGNVQLKPTRAHSFDATLEWYPGHGSSLTSAFFYKDVRDIILKSAYTGEYNSLAGNPQTFLITAPENAADGKVAGLELAGQTYFNNVPGLEGKLPEWAKGFGVSANYTYIDSKQKLHKPFQLKYCPAKGAFNNASLSLFGCDTNGLPFTDMPLQYLSKNAFNAMFLYDKGPLSMRLAYSWRSRFLQGVSVNGTNGDDGATSADPTRILTSNGKDQINGKVYPAGTKVAPIDVSYALPTWQESDGQLDFGVDYRFTPRLQASFSASNLTDRVIRQTQQQHIGNMIRAYFEPGRAYRLSLRYSY